MNWRRVFFFDVCQRLSMSVFSLSAVDQWFCPGGSAPTGRSSVALPCCAPSLLRCFHLLPDCLFPGAEFHGGGRQHAQSRSSTSKNRLRLQGHGCLFCFWDRPLSSYDSSLTSGFFGCGSCSYYSHYQLAQVCPEKLSR